MVVGENAQGVGKGLPSIIAGFCAILYGVIELLNPILKFIFKRQNDYITAKTEKILLVLALIPLCLFVLHFIERYIHV